MTQEPSDPGPRTPEQILAEARRRGIHLRRRRAAATYGGGGVVAAGLIALVVTLAWPGGHAGVVNVAGPPSSTSLPPTTRLTIPGTLPSRTTLATISGASSTSAPAGSVITTVPTSPPTVATPINITVTDADNGKTVTVPPGSTVKVRLAADNWNLGPASDPAVLTMTGPARQTRTSPCIPGGTCGTTTATYSASRAGQARISAGRSYCGEAIRCMPSTDSWYVTVVVM